MDNEHFPQCEIELDVPFHDVDMLQVVWHGNYFKYFEQARTALLRCYDFDVPKIMELGYSVVVIECFCRFFQPIRYGTPIKIHARLVEMEYRLKIEYTLYDAVEARRLARGYTTHATLDAGTGELFFVTPDAIIAALSRQAQQPGLSKQIR